MRYFIPESSDGDVYELKYFKQGIAMGEFDEIILLEMKREIGGEMWCEIEGAFTERGECGKLCECNSYSPCNGKNGRCRHLKNGFEETGKKFVLTATGLREIAKEEAI